MAFSEESSLTEIRLQIIEIESIFRRKKLHKTNQDSCSNGECIRVPIKSRCEKKSKHLKTRLFLVYKLIQFNIKGSSLKLTSQAKQ